MVTQAPHGSGELLGSLDTIAASRDNLVNLSQSLFCGHLPRPRSMLKTMAIWPEW